MHAISKEKFLKRRPPTKRSILLTVKTCCAEKVIVGSDLKSWVTTYWVNGTLETNLFEASHLDSAVALRTGHRDSRFL